MNRLSRKIVVAAASVGALTIGGLMSPSLAKARMPLNTSITGPATVEDGVMCTWSVSTDLQGSLTYKWELSNSNGTSVVSVSPTLNLALDKSLGTHQGLQLTVSNGTDSDIAELLVGIYFKDVGTPDCHD